MIPGKQRSGGRGLTGAGTVGNDVGEGIRGEFEVADIAGGIGGEEGATDFVDFHAARRQERHIGGQAEFSLHLLKPGFRLDPELPALAICA